MKLLLAACEGTDLGTAAVAVAGFVFLGFVIWVVSR